jgi:hypothetical protein
MLDHPRYEKDVRNTVNRLGELQGIVLLMRPGKPRIQLSLACPGSAARQPSGFELFGDGPRVANSNEADNAIMPVMSFNSRFNYPPAIARTVGFDLVDSGNRSATIEIVTDTAKHANPMGTIGCEQSPSPFT